MKRFTHYLSSLLVIAAFGMYSCQSESEPSTTTINYENDVPDGSITVNYTVQIVPGNGYEEVRVSGLSNATVLLTQGNETVTTVTDQSGNAYFEGMKNGTVTGTVVLDGYVTTNFTANIDAGDVKTDNPDEVFYSSSTVTLFERNAAIEGRIWGDYIFLGVDPPTITSEFTAPTSVYVVYEVGDDYPMGYGSGMLTSVNLEITTFRQTTPPTGVVDMQELPGTIEGVLEARFFMEDVVIPDPTPGSNKVFLFNIQPIENSEGMEVNLIPGSTLQLGDMEAMLKI